ncbi:MAG: ATP-binding cassette domain-containing protein [Acetobacteraceae bacterium]|nr:ATP-binding cassette domain-containing protein [Acetobacteraceae bacterium]
MSLVLHDVACRHRHKLVIEGVSATFGPGLSAIAGANGAGKTTLLRAIAGLHPLASGRVAGNENPALLGFLPQRTDIDRRFPLSCRDFAALGTWSRTGAVSAIPVAESERIAAAFIRMGIADLADRPIARLSSGQFQRLMFARLIVQDTPIMLLDEPFTAVDAATESVLIDQLLAWRDEGRVVVAVLHDHDMIRAFFPHTLLLGRGPAEFGASGGVLAVEHRFPRSAA